jgi:CBS domain-containing protein
MIRVAEVMTRGVRSMAPQESLQLAAQAMDDLNVGAIPVCEDGRVIGMVTDRDIVVRASTQNLPMDRTPLCDVMTGNVRCCYEDQTLHEVTAKMEQAQIRRLPVLDRAQRLVGMLSLGDVATKGDSAEATRALTEISEPAEPDRSPLLVGPAQAAPRLAA